MDEYDNDLVVRRRYLTERGSPLSDYTNFRQGDMIVAQLTIRAPKERLENVAVVERYTVNDDQSRLDYQFTITDSETFTEPAMIEGYRLALEDTVPVYDCQTD